MPELDLEAYAAFEEKARQAFEKYDVDKSGNIDKDELKALMIDLGMNKGLNEDQFERDVQSELEQSDFGAADGKLDYDEFVGLYNEFINYRLELTNELADFEISRLDAPAKGWSAGTTNMFLMDLGHMNDYEDFEVDLQHKLAKRKGHHESEKEELYEGVTVKLITKGAEPVKRVCVNWRVREEGVFILSVTHKGSQVMPGGVPMEIDVCQLKHDTPPEDVKMVLVDAMSKYGYNGSEMFRSIDNNKNMRLSAEELDIGFMLLGVHVRVEDMEDLFAEISGKAIKHSAKHEKPEVAYEAFKEWIGHLNRDQTKHLAKQTHVDPKEVKEAIDTALRAKLVDNPAEEEASSEFNRRAHIHTCIEVAYVDLPFGPSDELVEAVAKLLD